MDGALTPVNSPAVTLQRRHQAEAGSANSSNIFQTLMQSERGPYWDSVRQQPAAAQGRPPKGGTQEMDSLLAAEKVQQCA